MALSKEDSAMLILLVGEAAGVFASFCPSWFTVASPFFQEQAAHEGNIRRIRWGEAAATVIVVATGAAVSYAGNSKVPLYAAIGISAIMIGGYEYMIAHPATEDGDTQPTKSNPFRILKPCQDCG